MVTRRKSSSWVFATSASQCHFWWPKSTLSLESPRSGHCGARRRRAISFWAIQLAKLRCCSMLDTCVLFAATARMPRSAMATTANATSVSIRVKPRVPDIGLVLIANRHRPIDTARRDDVNATTGAAANEIRLAARDHQAQREGRNFAGGEDRDLRT